jgi:hypothetical protein
MPSMVLQADNDRADKASRNTETIFISNTPLF